MRENDDNAVVVDVEIDGLDSVVTVDAPESLRAKLRYTCDVRVGKKVSFQVLLRIDDNDGAGDEVKEEGDQNLGEDDDDDDDDSSYGASGFNKKAKSSEHDSGKKDECGDNPSAGCKGFNEESDNSCPENRFGQDDGEVPCNETKAPKSRNSGATEFTEKEQNGASSDNVDDENWSAKPEQKDGQEKFCPGENRKEADDFVKRETSAEDTDESVRDECRPSECDKDSTFKYEESHDEPFSPPDWDYDYYDQFDWSCSFDDAQNAEFLSDLDFRYCNQRRRNKAEVEEEGVENLGEDDGTSSEFDNKAKSTKKDECGNDASDCKDFKGSYENLDEECERSFHGSQSGQEDRNVPQSSWSGNGDNAKEADDCFKEEAFVEDHRSSFDDKKAYQSHATHEDDCHVVQDDIMSERERMKETDGYKRAVEEEWAARQQEIQNQAEEARTLRKRRKLEMSEAEKKAQEAERNLKRKKAEELRVTNLQKRLKERVQEFKDAERKEEADKIEKERHRVAARQYISWLESKCKDLPSLLHTLGIGGSKPSPVEVRKAYKLAVLKYHPDHSSKAGIWEQVQAEEIFKLIRKMNEEYFTNAKGRH